MTTSSSPRPTGWRRLARPIWRATKAGLRRLGFFQSVSTPVFDERLRATLRQIVAAPTPLLADVGAFHGKTVGELLDTFPSGHVHAFEPGSEALQVLRPHFGQHPRVTLHEAALGATPGTVELHENAGAATNSVLATAPGAEALWAEPGLRLRQTRTVRCRTLDEVAAEQGWPRIDFLKMDVQGFELHVLQGATRLLQEHRIGLIFLEVIFVPSYVGQAKFEDILRFLGERGYGLLDLGDLYRQGPRLYYTDALFAPVDVLNSLSSAPSAH